MSDSAISFSASVESELSNGGVLVGKGRCNHDEAGLHPRHQQRRVRGRQGVESVGEDDDRVRAAPVIRLLVRGRARQRATDRRVPDLGHQGAWAGAASRNGIHHQTSGRVRVGPGDGLHAHPDRMRLCRRRRRSGRGRRGRRRARARPALLAGSLVAQEYRDQHEPDHDGEGDRADGEAPAPVHGRRMPAPGGRSSSGSVGAAHRRNLPARDVCAGSRGGRGDGRGDLRWR